MFRPEPQPVPNINEFLFPKTRQLGLRQSFGVFDFTGNGLHGPISATPIQSYSARIAPVPVNLNAGVLSDARNRVAF